MKHSELWMHAVNIAIFMAAGVILACCVSYAVNAPHLPAHGTGWNPCYVATQCRPSK